MSFLNGRFVRNVAAVAGGAALGQMILVLASPLITRLYGPESFGTWGVFNSVAMVIIPVSSLAYSTAIVLPRTDDEAQALVRVSVLCITVVSLLTTIVFLVFQQPLASLLGLPKGSSSLMGLVGVYVFVNAVGIVGQQWIMRKRAFGSLAVTNGGYSVFTAGAQIAAGVLFPSGLALVVANISGRTLHTLLLSLIALNRNLVGRSPSAEVRETREGTAATARSVASSYRQFPLYRAPQVLLDGASQALPIAILSASFGPGVAGFYALCRTVLALPGQIIGNAVGDVLYPRIAEAFRNGQPLSSLLFRASAMLALATAAPFLVVVAFGPMLFGFVFGDEWRDAGLYAQWMSLWLWSMVSNRAAIQAIHVLSLQRFHLVYTILTISTRAGVLLVSVSLFNSALVSIATFSVLGVCTNLTLIAIVAVHCKCHDAGSGRGSASGSEAGSP